MMKENNPCEAQKIEKALLRIPEGQLLLFPKDAHSAAKPQPIFGHDYVINMMFSLFKLR